MRRREEKEGSEEEMGAERRSFMAKRIILVSATLLCVILCLLIYRQTTRDFAPPVERFNVSVDEPSPSKPGGNVEMIKTGDIGVGAIQGPRYVTRDEDGRVTREFGFYERLSSLEGIFEISKPWVKFHGKDGRIIVITAPLGSMPLEFVDGQLQEPARGSLKGGVRIEIYGPSEQGPGEAVSAEKKEQSVEYLVELDQVDFEREFSQLVSTGRVTVSGRDMSVAGSNLSLQYDQLNERLQMLEMAQLEQLRLKASASKKSPMGAKADDLTEPAKAADERSKKKDTYIMSLTGEVVVRQGGKKLTAQGIEIQTSQDFSRSAQPEKPKEQTDSGKATGQAEQIDSTQETVITCQGPLLIRAVEEGVAAMERDQLEFMAYGNPGDPVQIWDEDVVVVQAMRVRYNSLDKMTRLLGPVRLSIGQEQYATAELEADFDQEGGLVALRGPGQVNYVSSQGDLPATIDYQDQVLIKFAGDSGGSNFFMPTNGRDELSVEWIRFAGGLRAKSENSQMEANGVTAQFVLTDDGMSQLQSVTAQGPVRAEDPNWIIEASEELYLSFAAKDSGKKIVRQERSRGEVEVKVEIEGEAKEKGGFDLGMGGLFGRAELGGVVATGTGGGVRLSNKQQKYQLVGDRASGDMTVGRWEIWGEPAEVELAQQGHLESENIQFDLKAGVCTIPAGGSMTVMSETDLAGEKLDKPMPIKIAWGEKADYSVESNEIVFYGVTAEFEQKTKDYRQQSILTCPRMTVTLVREAEASQADRNLSKLTAHGPGVRLVSRQYGLIDGELLARMEMQTVRLCFDNSSELLTAEGEGWIEVVDYGRDRQADDEKKKKSLDQIMAGSLGSNEASYTLVQFLKQMEFNIGTEKVQFHKGVVLHRLPLVAGVEADPHGDMNVAGMFRLHCDELEVVSNRNVRESTSSDQGELIGIGGLSFLRAQGRMFSETISMEGVRHFFAGKSLEYVYDGSEGIIIVRGSEAAPVRFDQMQLLWVRYNLSTGAFEGDAVGQSVVPNRFEKDSNL